MVVTLAGRQEVESVLSGIVQVIRRAIVQVQLVGNWFEFRHLGDTGQRGKEKDIKKRVDKG